MLIVVFAAILIGSGMYAVLLKRSDVSQVEDIRSSRENCRLLGIVSRMPSQATFIDETLDRFRDPLYSQQNGWGIGVYSDINHGGKLGIPGVPMVIRSDVNVEDDLDLFHAVRALTVRLQPACILAHLRNASSGCSDIADPHPFQREINGKTFLFVHNGGIWGNDLQMLITELLEGNEQTLNCPGTPIDSEYLFLYLLQILETMDSDPYTACKIWTKNLLSRVTDEWNGLNFILTDGETLWAVRCSYRSSSFPLHYYQFQQNDAYAISTEALDYGWHLMENFSVIELKIGSPPRIEAIPEIPAVTPMPEMIEESPKLADWAATSKFP
jgi:predicted glutamine amidotransferase